MTDETSFERFGRKQRERLVRMAEEIRAYCDLLGLSVFESVDVHEALLVDAVRVFPERVDRQIAEFVITSLSERLLRNVPSDLPTPPPRDPTRHRTDELMAREACADRLRRVLHSYRLTLADAGWTLTDILMADVINIMPADKRLGFIDNLAHIMRITASTDAAPLQ